MEKNFRKKDKIKKHFHLLNTSLDFIYVLFERKRRTMKDFLQGSTVGVPHQSIKQRADSGLTGMNRMLTHPFVS